MDTTLSLILTALFIIGGWKVYEKAGKPGWGFLIPFYDFYLFLDIAGRASWFIQLWIGPIVVAV